MVMTVMLSQGINEKGAEKHLKGNPLFCSMAQKLAECSLARGRPLMLLYCGDGKPAYATWQMKEIKNTIRLIQCICPNIQITHLPFSFHDTDAAQKLDEGDVFYFKGFGGGVDDMQRIFGGQDGMRQVVETFQNRIMFSRPDRCSLLTIMVCGAAINMGTHYPDHGRLVTLKLLGDAYVQYHACATTANIQVTADNNVIQLAPGVANIMWFEAMTNRVDISACVVAKSRVSDYAGFAARSEEHIRDVMQSNAFKWRIYGWEGRMCWACRADGLTAGPHDRIRDLLHHMRNTLYVDTHLCIAHDQSSIVSFWEDNGWCTVDV